MRFILIGLSLIFFILSALIVIKALELPARIPIDNSALADKSLNDAPLAHAPLYPKDQEVITSELDDAAKNLTDNQNPDGAVIADLKATIAQLEDKLKTTERTIKNNKTIDIEIYPQTLAVFSGKMFRPGHDVISEVAISEIEKLIKEISKSPNSLILIEGHTDNIPTGKINSNNMDLSVRRAKTIANALISRGISPERIAVTGYGDTRPIDNNKTEEGRAKNRRVEVKLMLKEGDN